VRIRVATDDDAWATGLQGVLSRAGHRALRLDSWAAALVSAADPETGLLLVDATLPGASGPLLAEVAAAAGTEVTLRALRGPLAPILPVRDDADLVELAAAATPPLVDAHERKLLEFAGLGPSPLEVLQGAARTPTSVLLQGERGTGKQWVAQLIHRLAHLPGPFVNRDPHEEIALHGAEAGTLFLDAVHLLSSETLSELTRFARATGWKLVGATREPPSNRFAEWTQIHLVPLRDRPRDIRPLAKLYLETWGERLDLPRRRVHHALWKLIDRHPWPGNLRELETFVVQAATSSRGAMISRGSLPPSVLSRLDPVAREVREAHAFEEMAEDRLRGIVHRYQPDPDVPSLYRLVIDASERALFRLALQRTGGNQKAAATLLGVARNTLRSRLHSLDLGEESG